MTAPGPDWVEQARRFAAGLATEHPALTDALGGLLGSARAEQPTGDSAGHSGGGSSGDAAECRSCPLCAGLAALRGRRPDLLEALADVLTGAATALRTTAGTARPGSDADAPVPEPSDLPEETVPHPAPAPAVQRIDVA
jgi:hypothetical protein